MSSSFQTVSTTMQMHISGVDLTSSYQARVEALFNHHFDMTRTNGSIGGILCEPSRILNCAPK